jgi:hypothetical protein
MVLELEQERLERKQAEELVAHNARQIKSLQERLQAKDEELKRLEAALELLKKGPLVTAYIYKSAS